MKEGNDKYIKDSFRLIDLNDLAGFSPWPARLLGLSDWTERRRDGQLVLSEYGQKWDDLFKNYQKQTFSDVNAAADYLLQTHFPAVFLFHIEDRLYHSRNNKRFWNFIYSRITDVLTEYLTPDDTLVELGCGWGRNLFYFMGKNLCKRVIGGEYTDEGLKLARRIAGDFDLPADFHHFDYYNPDEKLMEKLKGTVVFTHNSIEQISYIPETTVAALREAGPKVVIHFEPVHEFCNEDKLLHYMWKRYTEMNDYNRNLLTRLKEFEKRGLIRITMEKAHVIGLNAFNPGSFLAWEPVID